MAPLDLTRQLRPAHVLALAGGAALLAYAVLAATRSLTLDEAVGLGAARGSLSNALERALDRDPGQVGYRLVAGLVSGVGENEWLLRLPSVLAVAVSCVCVAWIASTLAGRASGMAAAGMLAVGAGVAEVSQLAQPYALALAATSLSTALFARAMSTGGRITWVAYGLVTAALPLAHPLAIAIVAAQVCTLIVARGGSAPRFAAVVAVLSTCAASLFAAAAAVDRLDTAGGGNLSARAMGLGAAGAVGFNVITTGLAVWGLALLAKSARRDHTMLWQPVLVGGLIAAPAAALLVAATAMPVFPRHGLVLAAPGACVAAGIGFSALRARTAYVVAGACAAIGIAGVLGLAIDTRGPGLRDAVAHVVATKEPGETVVAVPARAGVAIRGYAPALVLHGRARGDGAWLLVAGRPQEASALARRVVDTPRYALLEERTFGDKLVLQHWVRP